MKKGVLGIFVSMIACAVIAVSCLAGNAVASDKDGTIYFLHKGLDYYAWVAMQEQFVKYAKDTGYKFEILNAENDAANQVNQFKTVLTQKPKAIIVTAIDSESLISCVEEANAAGVPVGVFDTPITGGKIAITVDCDNVMAGKQSAELIVDALIAKNGSAKGKVLNVYGDQASQVMRERKEGFDNVIKKYPEIEYIEAPGYGDRLKSQDATANAIAKYNYIDAVHAPCDNAGYGLYEALLSTDNIKKVGEPGHVIMVTIDGEPLMLDRINEGLIDASVNLDWHAVGSICLEMMDKYTFKGQDVPYSDYSSDAFTWKSTPVKKGSWGGPWISLPTHKITKENANDPKSAGRYSANVLGIKY